MLQYLKITKYVYLFLKNGWMFIFKIFLFFISFRIVSTFIS